MGSMKNLAGIPGQRASLTGAAVSLVSFAVLGTVAALWENPLFIRMTPAGGVEIALLAAQCVLFGLFFALRRPSCPTGAVGAGGVMNFIGIACPICNKVLVLIVGADLLLVYFEPVRLYVAAAGVLVTAVAVVGELRWWKRSPTGADVGAPSSGGSE